ncbi:unnamed protein product, partial [Dovyalis caffra]
MRGRYGVTARGLCEKEREGVGVVGVWPMEAWYVAGRLLVRRRRLGREGSPRPMRV